MLFDLIFAVLSLLWGMGMVLCWRLGLRDGMAAGKGKDLPTVIRPTTKTDPFTPEQVRLDNILANIDAYDGTERGQREV